MKQQTIYTISQSHPYLYTLAMAHLLSESALDKIVPLNWFYTSLSVHEHIGGFLNLPHKR